MAYCKIDIFACRINEVFNNTYRCKKSIVIPVTGENYNDVSSLVLDKIRDFSLDDLGYTEYCLKLDGPYYVARKPRNYTVVPEKDIEAFIEKTKKDIVDVIGKDWDSYKTMCDYVDRKCSESKKQPIYKISTALIYVKTGEILYDEDVIICDTTAAIKTADAIDDINDDLPSDYRLRTRTPELIGYKSEDEDSVVTSEAACGEKINKIANNVFDIIREDPEDEDFDDEEDEEESCIDSCDECCGCNRTYEDDDDPCPYIETCQCTLREELDDAYEEIEKLRTVITNLLFEKYNC